MSVAIERRALGAIAFVDGASGVRVADRLRVAGDGVHLTPNPSGLWVIRAARGLESHASSFRAPPAEPPVESLSFSLTVEDPAGRYLPRSLTVRLPRSPARAGEPGAALTPIVAPLLPAAAALIRAGAAVLRVRVATAAGAPVSGALVRLTPEPPGLAPVLALSDGDGEAIAILRDAPPFLPSIEAEAGIAPDFAAAVEVIVDREAARVDAPVLAVNPDRVLARLEEGAAGVTSTTAPPVRLGAGRTARALITVAAP